MKKLVILSTFLALATQSQAQLFPKNSSTKIDTLKGSNTEFRNFWDVKKYELSVEADAEKKSVKGKNKIALEITKDVNKPIFQIDLLQPMNFKFLTKDKNLKVVRENDFIFISSKKSYKKGDKLSFEIEFSGNPQIAHNAPWDGGWVFSKDSKGNDWISVAQEGLGASHWLPIKDIWSDEPDEGIKMTIITPQGYTGVGNGRLISTETKNGKTSYTWEVKNPINAYSIIPTIGKMVHINDHFSGEKGKLDLDYYVLEENEDKAKVHFPRNVEPMLKAFEKWFGPYPFYEDSFKLVDTPYLGMEHQSNVAYGNKYMNGYLGRDLSGTGSGLEWDYIIVHEAGHEWFANNITAKDQADMWIHEGFTTYSEVLFQEEFRTKEIGNKYAIGLRRGIANDRPLVGNYGIRNEGSGDMYPKGANMIHTIRQVINDDAKFRAILRGLGKEFYHQTVTTSQIEDYISKNAGFDFSTLFNQYLRTTKIPTLEYSQNGKELKFRYTNSVDHLKLPIRVNSDQKIEPTSTWQTILLKSDAPVALDKNYYIHYKAVK